MFSSLFDIADDVLHFVTRPRWMLAIAHGRNGEHRERLRERHVEDIFECPSVFSSQHTDQVEEPAAA